MPSFKRFVPAYRGLALLLPLALVGCDVNRGEPLEIEWDDEELAFEQWEEFEVGPPTFDELPDPPAMPAAPLEAEGVHFPDGLSTEDLARGRIALFDGQTFFGWSVDGGEASVARPEMKLHDKDDSGCAAGAEFRMPLAAGTVHIETWHPVDGEVWASFADGWVVGDRDYPFLPGKPAETVDQWTPGQFGLNPPPANPESLEGADITGYFAPAILGIRGNDGTAARYIEFLPDTELLSIDSFTPVDGSEATVTRDGPELHLTGGPGFLRSEQQYGDFVLQCEVKCNSKDSNSGIFFRTIEPTADAPSNGYEMQLQNTLGPGGRTDPDDYQDGFGTGGIFRRQPARYINANDGEWFHVTLFCVGNRMATWVNGLQVTDFTDERDLDPNPRKGRRDDAGYIVLQGHDPTTDVSFRNFRIQSLDPVSDADALEAESADPAEPGAIEEAAVEAAAATDEAADEAAETVAD
ncbi:3-keto-disaccharide hydrolase [Alienimonas chondri]|uniref:3-keto-alpha-glucoside-1,2-lyase/3-keto-2-hydroxy-glucal hydratase domain-containing protein n=1 Tax=Alienimonas chondri TaxID=2681879 RepID=A0ABX1VDP4_9PLAN|nr:DUF1080 domain-containing protein [Alienimonas chondri]NNJ26040.1 hypothetical protein [Alienimonas chondri]